MGTLYIKNTVFVDSVEGETINMIHITK